MPNCFQVAAMEAKVLGQIQTSVRARGEGSILMKGRAGWQLVRCIDVQRPMELRAGVRVDDLGKSRALTFRR